MTQSPETNVQAIKRLPRDENREATSWIKAGEWFASTYYKPLLAFVRAKLAGGGVPQELEQDAIDYLHEFLAREWDDFPVCSHWDPSRGPFRPLLLTAVSNFVDTKLLHDSPPATTEEYELYRKPLEAHICQRLLQQAAGEGGGSQVKPLARSLLAEDYVREFLEYLAPCIAKRCRALCWKSRAGRSAPVRRTETECSRSAGFGPVRVQRPGGCSGPVPV